MEMPKTLKVQHTLSHKHSYTPCICSAYISNPSFKAKQKVSRNQSLIVINRTTATAKYTLP